MFCDYRNESGLHPIGDQKNYFKSFWMKDERDRRKKKARRRARRRKEEKRKKEEQNEEGRPVMTGRPWKLNYNAEVPDRS